MRAHHKKFLIILFFAYLISSFQSAFAQNLDDFSAKRDPATNLIAEREKLEIYSKLRDRRCTTMTLAECNCPDAKEMKAYIDALIETGVGKEDIFYKVARKFSPNTILDKQIKARLEERLIKEAGEKRPQIVLEPASFDFGAVTRKQKSVSKIFKLSNNGNDTLIVKRIKTSCPCTLVALRTDKKKTPYYGTEGSPADWKAEVKPQDSVELEVMLDLLSPHIKNGKAIRDVTVVSNDPLYPEMTVRVEAVVED